MKAASDIKIQISSEYDAAGSKAAGKALDGMKSKTDAMTGASKRALPVINMLRIGWEKFAHISGGIFSSIGIITQVWDALHRLYEWWTEADRKAAEDIFVERKKGRRESGLVLRLLHGRIGSQKHQYAAMIRFASTDSRRETGNIKWDLQGPIPFGIADMDIESPPCVVDALQQRLNHRFYGYAFMTDELRAAICTYLHEKHGATLAKPEWLHELPGCVPAFTLVARTVCTKPEHEILVCSPAYPPMLHCHEDARCRLLTVPYVNRDGLWQFDWEAMEAAVSPNTRLFLLCNPHNPLGRAWRRDELEKVADFCERHDLILCSDEIHCDLVLDEGVTHQTALTLPEPLLNRVVMLSAPSKTFNIAGICFTYMAVPNAELRAAIRKTQGHSLPTLNVFAYAASLAAYTKGWEWHKQLIQSLRKNRQTVYDYMAEHLPMLKVRHQEATYLAWIDCSALGVESPHKFFLEQADVYLDNGANFGSPQCVRLNFATSPEMLMIGLNAMRDAVQKLQASRV